MSCSVEPISFGDLDFKWRQVFKNEARIPLTAMECLILEYVVRIRPAEASGSDIAAYVYGRTPSEYDIKSFWTILCNLRKKLREAHTVVTIETRKTGSKKRNYAAGLEEAKTAP